MDQSRQNQNAFVSGMMLALLTATVQAQGLDDLGEDHGNAVEAHVHGIASLNVALEGKFLELEFHTPAANVYGFEHAPRTETQFTQVREAQRTLQQADELFVLTHAAGCRLGRVELEQNSEEEEHTEEHGGHQDHGNKESEHNHHTEHAAHDEHDVHHKQDGHVQREGEEGGHNDLSVHYYYQCSAPEKLNSLDVGLFKAFPALEKLNLQLITPRVQQGKALTARSYRVDF